jgi:hypothetical protein
MLPIFYSGQLRMRRTISAMHGCIVVVFTGSKPVDVNRRAHPREPLFLISLGPLPRLPIRPALYAVDRPDLIARSSQLERPDAGALPGVFVSETGGSEASAL